MGWVRVCYHCPMAWQEYLLLARADRFQLHKELGDWIEKMNNDGEDDGPPPPPRTARRAGVF
jgi:hypothetical protein